MQLCVLVLGEMGWEMRYQGLVFSENKEKGKGIYDKRV